MVNDGSPVSHTVYKMLRRMHGDAVHNVVVTCPWIMAVRKWGGHWQSNTCSAWTSTWGLLRQESMDPKYAFIVGLPGSHVERMWGIHWCTPVSLSCYVVFAQAEASILSPCKKYTFRGGPKFLLASVDWCMNCHTLSHYVVLACADACILSPCKKYTFRGGSKSLLCIRWFVRALS